MEYRNTDFYITVYVYCQFTFRVTSRLCVGCSGAESRPKPHLRLEINQYCMSGAHKQN